MPWNRPLSLTGCALVAAALSLPSPVPVTARSDDDDDHHQKRFSARLRSFHEVPSISSPAEGSFRARLSDDGTTLRYSLTHKGLSAPVTQAHIHFGERHTNGGVMVWLCSGPAPTRDPTGLAPDCVNEGTVEGSITTANIVQAGGGALGQGIGVGEFEEFLRALRKGAGYANVHTTNFPGGELRGQVQ